MSKVSKKDRIGILLYNFIFSGLTEKGTGGNLIIKQQFKTTV